ncbi:hypothetical protein C8A01DRAFT_17432, partial [Parachaetomium inaequale]
TLAHLSKTCKQLNLVTTPHLYHRPACSNRWLLIRTLIARPDLALCVKQLHDLVLGGLVTGELDDPSVFPPEVARRFENSRFAQVIMVMARQARGNKQKVTMSLWPRLGGRTESLDMLASLCLNVELVRPSAFSSDIFVWNSPNPLMHLSHIRLPDPIGEPETKRISLALLARILTMAPHVTHLRCSLEAVQQSVELLAFPVSTHLIELTLKYSGISAPALTRLLAACPNLRAFDYDGSAHFTPPQVQEALVRHTPKLVSLGLSACIGHLSGNSLTEVMRSLAHCPSSSIWSWIFSICCLGLTMTTIGLTWAPYALSACYRPRYVRSTSTGWQMMRVFSSSSSCETR